MTPTSATFLQSATHVAFDAATVDRLLQIGATNVVRTSERLIIGPNRRDPVEHARARRAWWDSSEAWDQLYSSDVHWNLPIVLWVSANIDERVNLWRTCSWLRRAGIVYRDVLILEFGPEVWSSRARAPKPQFECTGSVAHHSNEHLSERLAQAHAWPRARYDRAVSLWDRYVDANPLRFAQTCARGLNGFPELAGLWAFLSSFFPRRSAEGALLLSRFDELLLTVLSTEWATPVSLFVDRSQPGEALRQLLYCTGDVFLPRRLAHWADHDQSAAVERSTGSMPSNPMKAFVYRITERGMRLRAGVGQLTDAPSLPVAGTEAYLPSAPWALLEDGRLARL
jgi:hypothetical protein